MMWKRQGPAIISNVSLLALGPAIFETGQDDSLGVSAALSADARTMVMGAPGANDNTGYIEVYRKDGEKWTRSGDTIYGNVTVDVLGSSVDISADGKIIICGSSGYYADDRPGYVRAFELVSDSNIGTDTWKQIGQNIMSITVEANSDAFGWSVSISDDGMIVVGAPNSGINGKGSGHVRIYLLDDNRINWKQIGGDIDGDMSGDRLGHSVSLAANGTIVVIGAPHAHVNEKIRSGEVKVYQLDSAGSNWERLGKSIFGENDSDMFGWSVDISSDGNTIAIGSRGYNYRICPSFLFGGKR